MKKVFLGILAAAILVSVGATASLAANVGSGRCFVDTKKHIPGSPEISRFFRVCVANVLQFNP